MPSDRAVPPQPPSGFHALSGRPALRLVNADAATPPARHGPVRGVRMVREAPTARRADPAPTARRADPTAGTEVVRELEATDPRWVLAQRAQDAIEGGAAAILTPESRNKLMKFGATMGLRAFDCTLVLAIVQDYARTGGREPMGEMLRRLRMVPCPVVGRRDGGESVLPWMLAAVGLAGVMVLAGVQWVVG